MSNWRAVLVLLLVLLLPWRGSVAALLHCANHQPAVVSTMGQHATAAAHDTHGLDNAHAAPDTPAASPHLPTCDAQAHGCCVSVGIPGLPVIPILWGLSPAHFPPLLLPALTFEWPAQERPPRYL